jgi:hypothetical protein
MTICLHHSGGLDTRELPALLPIGAGRLFNVPSGRIEQSALAELLTAVEGVACDWAWAILWKTD